MHKPYIDLTTSQRIAFLAITEKMAQLQREQAAVFAELGLEPGTPASIEGNRLYVHRAPVPEAEPDAPAP